LWLPKSNTFSYFSISIWLVHIADIREDPRFICLGDLDSSHSYNESGFAFGVRRIADEILFYHAAFGNWPDTQRFMQYRKMIRENKRNDICREILKEPYEDQELQISLLADNDCFRLNAINIPR